MYKSVFYCALLSVTISCTKEDLIEDLNFTVESSFPAFSSTAENYSSINRTTGYYSKTSNFYKYVTLQQGKSLWNQFNKNYLFDNFDAITYDFDKDGYLDLFLFGMNSSTWGHEGNGFHSNGKYFIIPNFFNQSPPYKVKESPSILEFAQGGIDLQDINGDGRKEVLIFNSNTHQVGTSFITNNNNPPSLMGVVVLEVDESFNIVSEKVLGTFKSTHRGTSGDIDNDGDIDILNFPLGTPLHTSRLQRFPTILLNSGNGTFREELIFKDTSFEDYYYDFNSTAVNLFDLNNDGFLDLIFGYRFGTPPNPWPQYPGVNWFAYETGYTTPFILWGDGSGKFSFNNKTSLNINNELNFQLSLMGMGFTDFDKDGDIDIVLQSTRTEVDGVFGNGTYYDSYVMHLLENEGNGKFRDVTISKIDGYYHTDKIHLGDMGEMMAIDKNGDGWIDLVPKDVKLFGYLADSAQFAANLWWENIGGSFVRRIDN